MKNLMIYTNPDKRFNQETETLVKLQIDNSLEMGWKREEILLFTNFPYSYNGIEAKLVPDLYCDFDYSSNKILVIEYLLRRNLLEDDLYWYHDFDVYQNGDIWESDFENSENLALCSYAYKNEYQLGAFFFRKEALGIFMLLSVRMLERPRTRTDEKTFTKLVNEGVIPRSAFTELNVTYNLTQKFVHRTYPIANKPIVAFHFHPGFKDDSMKYTSTEVFMHGKNRLGFPLLSVRLITLLNKYGIQ